MFDVTLTAPANHSNPVSYPDKWTPLNVRGIDMNGVSPLLLGFLTEREPLSDKRKITHIVTKVPGHSWYYNQYHGTQYAGVSVEIFTVKDYSLDEDTWTFKTDMPWSEEFQKPREKKS